MDEINTKIRKISAIILIVSICLITVFTTIKVVAYKSLQTCLNGRIVYIDAGHGGKDNGASVDGVMEDAINMEISKYLYEELIKTGAYVLVSRTSDYDLASMYQKNRKREDLNNRVKYINKSKPDVFISIHLNTYPSSDVVGAQVFHQGNNKSELLAQSIQENLNSLTTKERKIKNGDYFILNNTTPVGVIVECGFLSNSAEREKLNDSEYQQKIAINIKQGIVDYFER